MDPAHERRILSRYAGVRAADVARIERVTVADVLAARSRGRRDADGQPAAPTALALPHAIESERSVALSACRHPARACPSNLARSQVRDCVTRISLPGALASRGDDH